MFDQLLRSAKSIGANETKYWSCLIRDTFNVDKIRIQKVIEEVEKYPKS